MGLGAAGCGDDDGGGSDAGTASGGGTSGGGGTPAPGGSSGSSGLDRDSGPGPVATGDGKVGEVCTRSTECSGTLVCLPTGLDDGSGTGAIISVCGQPCAGPDECEAIEQCSPDDGNVANAYCHRVARGEGATCGPGVATSCVGDRTCLVSDIENVTGTCETLCDVGADSDADGGMPGGGAGARPLCGEGEGCLQLGGPDSQIGVCGLILPRGARCDIDELATCEEEGDQCAPDDPSVLMTDPNATQWRCREDCSDDGICKAGMCMDVTAAFAFCYE